MSVLPRVLTDSAGQAHGGEETRSLVWGGRGRVRFEIQTDKPNFDFTGPFGSLNLMGIKSLDLNLGEKALKILQTAFKRVYKV